MKHTGRVSYTLKGFLKGFQDRSKGTKEPSIKDVCTRGGGGFVKAGAGGGGSVAKADVLEFSTCLNSVLCARRQHLTQRWGKPGGALLNFHLQLALAHKCILGSQHSDKLKIHLTLPWCFHLDMPRNKSRGT